MDDYEYKEIRGQLSAVMNKAIRFARSQEFLRPWKKSTMTTDQSQALSAACQAVQTIMDLDKHQHEITQQHPPKNDSGVS